MEQTKELDCKKCGYKVVATFSHKINGYREYLCPNADEKGNQHSIRDTDGAWHPDTKEAIANAAITGASYGTKYVGNKIAEKVKDEIIYNQKLRTEAMGHILMKGKELSKPALDHYVKTHGHSHANKFIKFLAKIITGQ